MYDNARIGVPIAEFATNKHSHQQAGYRVMSDDEPALASFQGDNITVTTSRLSRRI